MNVHQAYILWFVQYHFVQELDHILGQYTNYFEDPHPYVLRLINDKQDTLRMRHGENEEKKASSAVPGNKLFWWSFTLNCH